MALYPALMPGPMRRAFWKLAYEAIARSYQRADWTTMNYGFADDPANPSSPPMPELSASDAPERCSLGLYHRVGTQRNLTNLDVLEVGSGRGGGASFVHRYLGPRTTIGIDRSTAAVALSNQRETAEGLSYQVGDAENLAFGDASFDIVINVESCHCYGSIPTFLSEVHRVLRPGGALLLADLRQAHLQQAFDDELAACPLEVTAKTDITSGVVRSLVADSPRRQAMVEESAGFLARPFMRLFAGMQGSALFRDLSERRFVYHCYHLSKPADV